MTSGPPGSGSKARGARKPTSTEAALTVAVTGPTGTFGFGLMPLLEADDRIGTVVGVARRPFDPAAHQWTKMSYRRGDVRDRDALAEAFEGADVVVHLAFMITGSASREAIRAINVDGTLNAFRAAADAGAKRFVYASSVAAYGFHSDNPTPMTEEWPVRPADRRFYAQEKAELERLIADEASAHPELALYLLRPPIVVGPHTLGAKELPGLVAALGRVGTAVLDRISVDYYGTPTPIQQIASIGSPDPRQLLIQPWDASAVKLIEKAILNSDLGITPQNDGKAIRLTFPQLTEERRKELVKQIRKYAEGGKVAIRNIRRDAMETFKKKQKASELTEDDLKIAEKDLQKLTDDMCKELDALLEKKEKELMEV